MTRLLARSNFDSRSRQRCQRQLRFLSQTTRIKVIDSFYPLVGEVNIEPRGSLNILREKPNTILIDKDTKKNLDLKLGDKIKIQNISFDVIGVINNLPDIPGFFLFGNQALVSKTSYQKLETKNLGSFINFKYKRWYIYTTRPYICN